MLKIIVCIGILGIFLTLVEFLGRQKILNPELKRKLFHVIAGSFIAFWPWLVSWHAIEFLGFVMILGLMANYRLKWFNFTKGLKRKTYGDSFLALAIVTCAFFANSKLFFTLAILNVAVADALAALSGQQYGKSLRYKVLGQNKTLIGTMTFWLVSLCIFGIGLPFAHNQIDFNTYEYLIILLPPLAAFTENFSVYGIDNFTVPVLLTALLRMFN